MGKGEQLLRGDFVAFACLNIFFSKTKCQFEVLDNVLCLVLIAAPPFFSCQGVVACVVFKHKITNKQTNNPSAPLQRSMPSRIDLAS